MRALSDYLWRERDLLEGLAHRLEVEQLLLANGRVRRLPLASRELATAVQQVRSAELGRAAEADAAARVLGLTPPATLQELARTAPPPWGEILADHRTALLELVAEITELTGAPSGTLDDENFLSELREDLHARVQDAAAPDATGRNEPASSMADIELADAALEVQIEQISRFAAEERGAVLPQDLHRFLS